MNTVPQHLLTSNFAPLDAERTYILQAIADIDVVLSETPGSTAEREALVARAEQYKATLSPVRRVPAELICEILALVPCTRQIGSQTVDQAPWVLGHVCRSWRDWALGCPWLWRSFNIVYREEDSNGSPDFPLAMIETQLLRAGNVSLFVDFHWLDPGPETLQGTSFWDLLLPLRHRWQTLRIKLPDPERAQLLLDLLQTTKDHLTSLVTVELLVGGGDDNEWWAVECDLFSIAPRLLELLLTDVSRMHYSPNISAPSALRR